GVLHARPSRELRGCSSPSSESSWSGSLKTISAILARSAPSSPITSGPKRSTSSRLTSGSLRSRRWTISSLEIVAAPWRANASRAALLPAPIGPVIATARGFVLLLVGRRLGRGGFCRRRFLLAGQRRRRRRGRGVAEDVLGEIQVRPAFERRLALGAALGSDALHRPPPAAPPAPRLPRP